MNSTKDNWIKALQEWIKTQHGSAGWEMKLESFIAKVESEAIEKTNKRWRERIAIALARPVERKSGETIHELNYDAIYDLLEYKERV